MSNMNDTIAALRARRAAFARSPAPEAMRALADFGDNPGGLRALAYTPPVSKRKAPLVVALHGCSQTGEAYARNAGWLALADRHGFAVLCPEQTAANNPNLCFNWFLPGDAARGVGEAASIAAMVRAMIEAEKLDARRVYVTGLSAGGAMSAAMLAAYPDLFAGGAVIAGLPYGAASDLRSAFAAMAQVPQRSAEEWGRAVAEAGPAVARTPKVSIWHGDADYTVQPGAADALVQQWTHAHGVAEVAPRRKGNVKRSHAVWTSARGEPLVEYHRLRNVGHGTPIRASGPDACGTAAPYMLDIGVCSSTESLHFWGLVEAAAVRSDPSLPPSEPGPASPGAVAGVEAVISAALRKAGLMK